MTIGFIQPYFTKEEVQKMLSTLHNYFSVVEYNKKEGTVSGRVPREGGEDRILKDAHLVNHVKAISDKYNLLYTYLSHENYFMCEFKKDVVQKGG